MPCRLAPIAAALALALAAPTGAQSPDTPPHASLAPEFSGRYKLVLTLGRGCPAAVQVGPLSVLVDVTEAQVPAGSEVLGQSASASEPAEDARFVFLRQADTVHGAVGARDAPYVGFQTLAGYRVWVQIMADGTVTTSAGRAAAKGSAFGEIDLSLPGDADVDTIGYCQALDHTWSLEPL
jgi:hypothetical protein